MLFLPFIISYLCATIGPDSDVEQENLDPSILLSDQPRKRARLDRRDMGASTIDEWYPWADRIVRCLILFATSSTHIEQTCTLDILMHLPRSVFSRKQLDLFLWLLRINQVDDVPSVKSMTLLNKIMQEVCGVDTIAYKGKQGHVYHVNNLGQLLAQVGFRLSTN